MRVTSNLWVSALLRRIFSSGGYGAVLRRGGDSAGAIFIVTRNRLGEVAFFAPAPQTDYAEGRPDERRFVKVAAVEDDEAVRARVEREARFDPDVWFVEIEPSGDIANLFPVTTP